MPFVLGGYEQDDLAIDTRGDTNKPGIGSNERLYSVPGESFNSVGGKRMAVSNKGHISIYLPIKSVD